MIRIDLTNSAYNDVPYELITFNDGEPHIKLGTINRKETYLVVTRITNPTDLFILLQIGNILDNNGVIYNIRINYLMGMRMDRIINYNEAFSLKVIAECLKTIKYNKIQLFEAHSFRSIYELPRSSEVKINPVHINFCNDVAAGAVAVFPDSGAKDRYHDLVSKKLTVTCHKQRDLNNGNILNLSIDNPDLVAHASHIAVLDDLCDAGGTFMLLADTINNINPNAKKHIYITHAVNRVGIERLSSKYDKVIISNSYRDWDNLPENVTMLKCPE